MLGNKKMKLGRATPNHSRFRRGLLLQRFARHAKLRNMNMAVIFCVLTFSSTVFFSTITEGAKVASPARPMSIVSTKGKHGVAPPMGIITTDIASQKDVPGGATKKLKNTPVVIPPKPAWVSKSLFTDPTNTATQYAAANPTVAGAGYIARMGQTPVAQWFGDWNTNVGSDANTYVSAAASAGKVPVLVAYNIPLRDCGGYSVGGAAAVASYAQWAQQLALGIGNRTAVVILEPDALGAVDCLPAAAQQDRYRAISQAVTILKANAQTSVYIDAGTPVWQSTAMMSARLKAANVAAADGFSLNVSYFASTAQNRVYGDRLSSLIGYKHYVIDTSRNGGEHAVTGMQCNPSFASFGDTPTTNTGSALNDALLWIKIPWESDGPCNGSPGPGQPYWSYAIQLAQNAG